jgi:hypothetical protein
MTDEELEKLLERREARLRDELESQERDREYKRESERVRKTNQLQTRIMMGVSVGLLWFVFTAGISTCTARMETDRLEQRVRALEQKK